MNTETSRTKADNSLTIRLLNFDDLNAVIRKQIPHSCSAAVQTVSGRRRGIIDRMTEDYYNGRHKNNTKNLRNVMTYGRLVDVI